MDKLDLKKRAKKYDGGPVDLARRLDRYRRRLEAEGRQRSLRLIDRAIEDAGREAAQTPGKLPRETS
jgi:hypothetical protein